MGINGKRPPGDVRGISLSDEAAELTSGEQQVVADIERNTTVESAES